MDWLQDMITRWVRIISAAGAGTMPLDEAVRQVSAFDAAAGKKAGLGRLKRNAGPADEAPAVTVLCRQLIAGVLISDLLIERVCELAGQTREQALDQLIGDVPRQLPDQQLRVLQAELSGSCRMLRDLDRGSYGALGSRVEEVLALAEQQAREIVSAARTAADEITASARAQQPGSTHAAPD
jgi:hypothetical protein